MGGRPPANLWGTVPTVIEMQSEGDAGALHGALQTGALATTFTASQGLLLMIPNMYKIAGELTPTVFHVAARSLATQALSIFRRPQRRDGRTRHRLRHARVDLGGRRPWTWRWWLHASTLAARLPFLHFFDGFRTSHEVTKVEELAPGDLRAMIDDDLVRAHRARALSPDHPVIRGTAQNPDVIFPGEGDGQSVLPRLSRHRAGRHGQARRSHRPPLPPLRLRGGPRCSGLAAVLGEHPAGRVHDEGDDHGPDGQAQEPGRGLDLLAAQQPHAP